jgi:hypothetical protein
LRKKGAKKEEVSEVERLEESFPEEPQVEPKIQLEIEPTLPEEEETKETPIVTTNKKNKKATSEKSEEELLEEAIQV